MNVLFASLKRKSAKAVLVLATVSISAAPVSALSCMRPNLAQSFNNYAQAEETYVIARGEIAFSEPVPKYKEGEPRKVDAVLTGAFLGQQGLGKVQDIPLEIETDCAFVWCGNFPRPGTDLIAFIEKRNAGYHLSISPCPGAFKTEPTEQEIRVLQRCLRRGECKPWDIKRLEAK